MGVGGLLQQGQRTPFKCRLLSQDHGRGSICSLAVGRDPRTPNEAQIFAGTATGVVLRLVLSDSSSQASEAKGLEVAAQATVGKQAVQALVLLPELKRIAVLCGGQVLLLDMGALDAQIVLPAKGALFLVRDSKLSSQKSSRSSGKSCRLALATATRLLLLELRQAETLPQRTVGGKNMQSSIGAKILREWPGLDSFQALAWLGDVLIVAMRGQYVLISLKDNNALQLFALPSDSLQKPLIKVLPSSSEAVLVALQVGVVVNSTGQPSGNSLLFTAPPLVLGYSAPFIVSAQPEGGLEVHHRATGALVQALSFPSRNNIASCISDDDSGGLLVVATADQLWMLERQPSEVQARELLRARRFNEAVEVAAETQQGESKEVVAERVGQAHAQAALLLLSSLRFEEAAHHLALSCVEPAELFPLFPHLTGRWRTMIPRKRHWGLHAPLQALPEMIYTELKGEADLEAKKTVLFDTAVPLLIRYFEGAREKELSGWEKEGVDTLLLQLYLQQGADFVQSLENFIKSCSCSLDDAEQALRNNARYCSLAFLLNSRGLWEKSLAVWADIACGKLIESIRKPPENVLETQKRAVWEVSRLLQASPSPLLVKQHVPWMVEIEVEATLATLTSPDLPPETVLELLPSLPTDVRLSCLRWLIEGHQNSDSKYHTQYATALADVALEKMERKDKEGEPPLSPPTEDHLDKIVETRELLEKFLRNSTSYDPLAVMEKIEGSELWQEQAIVLRREGKHSAALQVLALKLRDLDAAERYCIELGEIGNSMREEEALLQLLDLYLHPEDDRPPLHREAVGLLLRHGGKLDPLRVVEALSTDMPLQGASSSLSRLLRDLVHRHRQGQIVRQLARSNGLAARAARVRERMRMAIITEASECGSCGRRIGSRLFALYPHNLVVCYQCLARSGEHVCPNTGHDFRTSDFPHEGGERERERGRGREREREGDAVR